MMKSNPMKSNPAIPLLVLSTCLAAPFASAQTTYPEPQQEPQQQPAPQKADDTMKPAKSFAELDLNADGKISKQEAAADPSLNKMFARHDTNHDGSLSEAEYSAGHMKDTGTKH
jgi:hypothetical protein